jgi:hypothetical protein
MIDCINSIIVKWSSWAKIGLLVLIAMIPVTYISMKDSNSGPIQ